MIYFYQEILNHFSDSVGLKSAIISNNPLAYYYLTQIIVRNSTIFKHIEEKDGQEAADQLLSEMLIAFRRNVKHGKVNIVFSRNTLHVGNSGNKNLVELKDYLMNLFVLIYETSPVNPLYQQSHEFEIKLVQGRGFQKLYELKAPVIHTLNGFGCQVDEEKEEIFNESLMVLWKKLVNAEIGIFFTGSSIKLDNCRVFNHKFYQTSKLSTFLTGISKNLFYNRTRTIENNLFRNSTSEIPELPDSDLVTIETDHPVLSMFIYYRNFIETRKIRSLISLLQYDCNLEDKEVRILTGLTNTRIHSCRLRNHFHEWYAENVNRIPELLDTASDYFAQRELMKEKLNKKILVIDLFQRKVIQNIDLKIFTGEFRTMAEYTQYHLIFKYIFYFTSAGKLSSLSGLPDEKLLRTLMVIYKKELFNLPAYQAMLMLLYYGSNEPDGIILTLLRSICTELSDLDQNTYPVNMLSQQLRDHTPDGTAGLNDEIYQTNKCFFNVFKMETTYIHAISNIHP